MLFFQVSCYGLEVDNSRPLPVHVYHKELWDSQFTPYFYQICHGIMFPLYKMLYDKDPLRCSPESEVDILPVARWFGRELYTYVRVFTSSSTPHVLPLHIPNKLLAREISYQTCGKGGLTKDLKDKKKAIWPQFPVSCGAFSLFYVGHAFTEVKNMTCL